MNIRCKKHNCIFNKSMTCAADNVAVGSGGLCDTYKEDKDKKEFEFADELNPMAPKNVPLRCKSEICLYNRMGRCTANGISVISNEESDRADCATFIER